MLNGHGDDGYRYKHQVVADFSTNVWHDGEPAGLKQYVWERWDSVNRYPEVIAETLSETIARHHGVKPNQVLVNNGTTESIYLLAQLFSGSKTAILTPGFSEYEDACDIYGHELQFVPWTEATELPQLRADVLFICNPNNPTGKVFEDLVFWIKRSPGCLFVIDEAFIDFTMGVESAISFVSKYRNVVVLRSLTKAYAIPGLRLGYVVANEELIGRLTAIRQPWTVNALAQAAGEFIFNHYADIQLDIHAILEERDRFAAQLRENDAIEVEPSSTHFFICKTLVRNAGQLKDFLLEKHGILIRDAGNFRGLTRQHFRIATLGMEQNTMLINALQEWKQLYY